MARRHESFCACGKRLGTAIEMDTGLCLLCLKADAVDPYEGHEHCDPERAAARIDYMQDTVESFTWTLGGRKA